MKSFNETGITIQKPSIRSGVLLWCITTIGGSIWILLTYLLLHMWKSLSFQTQVKIVGLETLLLPILSTYIFFLLQKIKTLQAFPKFIKMYGLLWDKEANPHCPADETLASFTIWYTSPCINCPKCNKNFFLHDENQNSLSHEQARKNVLEEWAKILNS